MPNSSAAARFDRASQGRRAMLAKIHVAKKQLGIVEDDYRQLLFDATGQTSAGDCDEGQLERVIERLKALGFKPLPRAGDKAAMHPMARKARALWISLYQLGAVRNPSERALEAFARRQLGCERLVWARQGEAFRLIEALKAMADRAGWRQTGINGEKLTPMMLQSHLAEVILGRLVEAGVAPRGWSVETAAWRLCGFRQTTPWRIETYARVAGMLGEKLRAAGGGER